MKKAVFILFALMMILVSCDMQTLSKENELLLGSASPSEEEVFIFTKKDDGTVELTGLTEYGKGLSTLTFPKDIKITSIAPMAFYRNENLTEITIPESVTQIGESAFLKCEKLTTVIFPDDSKASFIDEYAFAECSELTTLELTSYIDIIGAGAFSGCVKLKSVYIPGGIESIGKCVFQDCISLESVKIPDFVTSIGTLAFQNCRALKTVHIPYSVTSVGAGAFDDCSSLEKMYVYPSRYGKPNTNLTQILVDSGVSHDRISWRLWLNLN